MNESLAQAAGKNARLILLVGSGGVGKTTSAACLGLGLAEAGFKAITITIDPARRLAQALGLATLTNEAQLVKTYESGGAFYAQWMDQKTALSDLVRKTTRNEEWAEKILRHRLFEIIEGHLGGVEEYLSLEKLLSIRESHEYDFCILDTAPSRHALDFLDSSQHLMKFFDEGILSNFLKTEGEGPESRRSFLGQLFKAGQEKSLGLFKKIFGATFFRELGELLNLSKPLHQRLVQVAHNADAWIRSPESRVLIVAAPDPRSHREVELMVGDLRARRLPQPFKLLLNRSLPQKAPPANLVEKHPALGEKLISRWKYQQDFLTQIESLNTWIPSVMLYPEVNPNCIALEDLEHAGRDLLKQWPELFQT